MSEATQNIASEQMPLLGGLDGLLSRDLPPEALEREIHSGGWGPVVCVDEAGRGPLAGPVVAGAVIFDGPCEIDGVDDSKRLRPGSRAALIPRIRETAVASAIGIASAEEIDEINILEATRLAAARAVAALGTVPRVALTDALTLPALDLPTVAIVRGDARVRAIGAASILAKEHRDALMRRAAREWPEFGFDRHFGYPTPLHRSLISQFGPTTIHRLTFHGAEPQPGKPLNHSRFHREIGAALGGADRAAIARLRRRIRRQGEWLPERERQELLARCAAC